MGWKTQRKKHGFCTVQYYIISEVGWLFYCRLLCYFVQVFSRTYYNIFQFTRTGKM